MCIPSKHEIGLSCPSGIGEEDLSLFSREEFSHRRLLLLTEDSRRGFLRGESGMLDLTLHRE
jgi:hypothetical protein